MSLDPLTNRTTLEYIVRPRSLVFIVQCQARVLSPPQTYLPINLLLHPVYPVFILFPLRASRLCSGGDSHFRHATSETAWRWQMAAHVGNNQLTSDVTGLLFRQTFQNNFYDEPWDRSVLIFGSSNTPYSFTTDG